MTVFLVLIWAMMTVTDTKPVEWLTAHRECQTNDQYLHNTQYDGFWSPDLSIIVKLKKKGCYEVEKLTFEISVPERRECYIHCVAQSQPYIAVIKTDNFYNCSCLNDKGFKDLNSIMDQNCLRCYEKPFPYCLAKETVRIYQEIAAKEKDYDVKVNIECNDTRRECVDIMEQNENVEIECSYINKRSRKMGSCKHRRDYECKSLPTTSISTPPSMMTTLVTSLTTDMTTSLMTTAMSLPREGNVTTDTSKGKDSQENGTLDTNFKSKQMTKDNNSSLGILVPVIVLGIAFTAVVVVGLFVWWKWNSRMQLLQNNMQVVAYVNTQNSLSNNCYDSNKTYSLGKQVEEVNCLPHKELDVCQEYHHIAHKATTNAHCDQGSNYHWVAAKTGDQDSNDYDHIGPDKNMFDHNNMIYTVSPQNMLEDEYDTLHSNNEKEEINIYTMQQ